MELFSLVPFCASFYLVRLISTFRSASQSYKILKGIPSMEWRHV